MLLFSFKITFSEGLKFSRISKDFNKIHVNNDFGKKSIFGDNITHGIFFFLKLLKIIENKKFLNIKKFINNKNYFITVNFLQPIFYEKKICVQLKNYKNFFLCEAFQDSQKVSEILFKKGIDLKKEENFKKKFKFKFKKNYFFLYKNNRLNTLQTLLNKISFFVGMMKPGAKSILNTLEMNYAIDNIDTKQKNISIYSRKIDKRLNLYSNLLNYKNFSINFKSSVRPDYNIAKFKNNKKVVKIIKAINKDIVLIGSNSGLGKSLLNILKINKKNKIICISRKIDKSLKQKNIFQKEFSFPKDLVKLILLIKKLNKPFIFYFLSPKIFFNNNFSQELKNLYNKIYIKLPNEILSTCEDFISRFIYPSTTNISRDPEAFYSKIKLKSEKLLSKYNKCFFYRFEKIYSRNTISIYNNAIDNFQQYLNKRTKLLAIFFN